MEEDKMGQFQLMLEAMADDEAFGGEMKPLFEKLSVAEIIAAAKKKGFEITEADWQGYLDWQKTLLASSDSDTNELNEKDLEAVAGGFLISYVRDHKCWFHGDTSATQNVLYRDGAFRVRCRQFACRGFSPFEPDRDKTWKMCRCFGTNDCVGSWHTRHSPECKID
ncbi:MAG: Nif11-like leader peptide family RiPP precursor [Defluviitaleaceae bacterium]|nr:Nif11-like leader peptide family RiPP precursor [Defluviitaleaceae bacterium]